MRVSRRLLNVLILVTLGYAVPAYAPPKCDGVDDPPACNKGGGDTGDTSAEVVGIHEHVNFGQSAPLWHPTDFLNPETGEFDCVMTRNSGNSFSGVFPRHADCAHLTTTGDKLQDDIIVVVRAHRGVIQDVQVQGQDVIGAIGVVYVSDVVEPFQVTEDADGNMVIHVHADNVMIYKCDTHVLKKKSVCDMPMGTFSIHDLVYTQAP